MRIGSKVARITECTLAHSTRSDEHNRVKIPQFNLPPFLSISISLVTKQIVRQFLENNSTARVRIRNTTNKLV